MGASLNYAPGPSPVATPDAAAGVGATDETYIELKCINPTVANPINNAWIRFDNDVVKIEVLKAVNGTLICQLATCGIFRLIDLAAAAPLSNYWGGIRSVMY